VLKQRRLSVTAPRLRIAEEVFGTDQHYTAEDLYDRLKRKNVGVGRVTVYRTLKLMVESGLVEMRDFGGQGRYEPVIGRKHHDHLVCIGCKRVVEFENESVEREQERIARQQGFELLHHVHTLFGRCPECRGVAHR
jgi:Fur family transcriptional regulator, ferric uptake regulator